MATRTSILEIAFFVVMAFPAGADSYFGIEGGVLFSSIGGSDWENAFNTLTQVSNGQAKSELRPSLAAGLFFESELFDFLAINVEFLISSFAVAYSASAQLPTPPYDFKTDTSLILLDVPIFVKPRLCLGSGNLFILLGPTLTKMLSSITTTTTNNLSGSSSASNSLAENQLSLGVTWGFGYEGKLEKGKFFLQLLVRKTFTDILRTSNWNFSSAFFILGYGARL
jgi:hypothetical protein